jgi:plastocyanin domain-containing protein
MKYVIGIIVGLTTLFVVLMAFVPNQRASNAGDGSNVRVENGVQIIDLTAKGGYAPNKTIAKAGLPTKLEVATDGTFDCSSNILIPSLSYTQQLPSSGTTEVDLGTPQVGLLQGTCGMGMYRFEIDFKG